ncbi:U-box domain-containing protein 21 [Ricinus communis]|uniref:U-box domain-containing protein n=1 Tax=Ricinus communis TaxID=3988 RepID=B9T5F5_RICCO|nr:U-box domain-containing protein 21 [Ricinus communis]EEF28906.1 E3 ubiquitin ligase PUB14, putative [Ricinus communis]|eukprot:XP_002533474.1 U-box domain-containing protein 21 [Ricinus communis]
MMLSWRTRRAAAAARKKRLQDVSGNDNLEMDITVPVPTHFRCPISLDLMKDPVTLSTGITYDRESIEKWVEAGHQTCPVTNQVLLCFDQIPNHSLRKMIQSWCVENRSFGIERIPTPRIPVSPYDVSEICKRIMAATQRGDFKKCKDLVAKIKNWGRESERNKRCIVENGVGCVLSIAFESFAGISMEKHADLLVDILSVLVWMFPFGVEGKLTLGSMNSLRCMLWILKNGDLTAKQTAVLVLKELLSLDQKHVNTLAEIGVIQELVKLIKKPISPSATKASLMVIFYMLSPPSISEKIASTLVELGLVSLIIEILLEGDKGISEKALGVLDHICDSKEGREKAYENALFVPVLFHKILGSDLASNFSVSILWKLCKNDKRKDGGVVAEALELKVGAFQKLLILLQVGCGENTKEKVKELLKLLNLYRTKVDCLGSSMDFRYLKKSY